MSEQGEDRPELTEARGAFEAGRFEAAIEAATPYLASPDSALRVQANRVAGLALFQQGQYATAANLLEAAAEIADNSDAWFNVATSATMAGEVERGAEAFQRTINGGGSKLISLPRMYFYYALALKAVEAYERMLEPLTWLRNVYAELTITDSTFLHIRGVPFLSHTLGVAVEAFTALDQGERGRAWMDVLAAEVDSDGRAAIARLRDRLPQNS